ncbi:uncharacterized protein LOC117300806 isoform X2 [Asterias rubens]|nr:uncharacterized protein LOC117300806 isoform X2 [Asterias rubens]XP_033640518.1 uncharacterized protein LOC117300806 isoform X2 [Asterias rubens]
MCSTLISAVDGENLSALQKRAFSSFRSTCHRESPLHRCEYFTEPATPHSFRFIMGPLSGPFKLDFEVKSRNGLMIALAERRADDSVFAELTLGGWNGSKTIFRACHSKTCKDLFGEYNEPGIVRQYEYRPFWIEYIKGVVTVGKGGQQMAFSQWDAGAYHGRVTSKVYVGISGGQNAPDAWVFNTKYVCE